MTPERAWEISGYADIVSATIADGELVVTFANGDEVVVPAAVAGDLDGATAEVEPVGALSVLVARPASGTTEISWERIRSATDPDYAQHLRELDAEESRRLARRIKALREDSGLAQIELAKLVGMTPPQLSKIEAGAHDMRVSTVRALLRAMGASFADVAGEDVPEVSVRRLEKQVVKAGLPADTANRLLEAVPRNSVYTLLGRAFGWTREAIASGKVDVAAPHFVVQFKAAQKQQVPDSPLIHLAASVSQAARRAAEPLTLTAVPSDPRRLRAEATGPDGKVSLKSLLEWTWSAGIPVIPMAGRGGFAAAVWLIESAPVIVVKEARNLEVFWLFDLAHELGHIGRGHIGGDGLVDLISPTALETSDEQEREANAFALELLIPQHEILLEEVRRETRGNYLRFKNAVADTAVRHGLNPGLLGMVAAHELTEVGEHKDRWGSATNLAKLEGTGRDVTRAEAEPRLNLDKLDELDAALIREAVLTA